MKIKRTVAAVAVASTGALVLAACTPPEDDDGGSGISAETSMNIAWEAPLNELNLSSVNGNATQNAVIGYMMYDGFNFYNTDLEVERNESFGTYEKVSDDPLTVKYTVGDKTQWSDGTAFDATDVLLQWAGTSAALNTVEATTDATTGEVTNQSEVDAGVFFDGKSPGPARITQMPTISDDGKSITFVYDVAYGDWELNFTNQFVPAHVVGQKSLGVADAKAAKEAVHDAIMKKDTAALSKVAKFWNTGFEFTKMPEDKSLALSTGAYILTEYKENQYLTLKANPKYQGSHKATIDTVTVRIIPDSLAQVQALENGELQLIGPQASADVLKKLEALKGITVDTDIEGTYEHVDLVFDNKGPFDPATYNGDAQKALLVRKAFLTALPRQQIVDNLIKPLNPDAEVRNSYILIPGSPNYDKMVKENGSGAYPLDSDVDQAKKYLAEAGVTGTIKVRMGYNNENPRRQSQLKLITDAVSKAGFEVVDAGQPAAKWGTFLEKNTTEYDASLFGWQSTSTAVTESEANYKSDGGNNYGNYANPKIDEIFNKLAVETDPEKQFELQLEAEKILWADAFGTTIFQFPSIRAWSTNLTGVEPTVISPVIFAGFWNWKLGS